jgi:alkylation response protein AidB-like acyl-CoA dehydrogenase
MSEPDPDAILYESPIHEHGRQLGERLANRFRVADQAFFREIARWKPLRPVLAGELGDLGSTADALIGLGEGCPNGGMLLSLGAHCFAAASTVARFAKDDDVKRVLRDRLASGAAIGAFAATEAGAGSDVMSLTTKFTVTSSGYALRGEKTWVSNAVNADLFVVFATKDTRLHSRGISAFLVERAAPGVTVSPINVEGARGASLGSITLADVHVGCEGLIGRLNGGAHVFRQAIIRERILLSAFLVGAILRALRRSTDYAMKRRQFGALIAANPIVSSRIVEMFRRYATAKLLLLHAMARLERGTANEADASLIKLHASESAVESRLDAFRIQGARGLSSLGGIDELLDALSSLAYSGTSDLQRVILAASLGLPA